MQLSDVAHGATSKEIEHSLKKEIDWLRKKLKETENRRKQT